MPIGAVQLALAGGFDVVHIGANSHSLLPPRSFDERPASDTTATSTLSARRTLDTSSDRVKGAEEAKRHDWRLYDTDDPWRCAETKQSIERRRAVPVACIHGTRSIGFEKFEAEKWTVRLWERCVMMYN